MQNRQTASKNSASIPIYILSENFHRIPRDNCGGKLCSFRGCKKLEKYLITCCCEFVAHFGDGLTISAAAIVHAFADKLDLPDAVGQQEAFAREQPHFRHHLREHCSTPAPLSTIVVVISIVVAAAIVVVTATVVAGIVVVSAAGVAAVFSTPFAGDAKPVELDDWAVLSVPHHRGLNHFPEKWAILYWFLLVPNLMRRFALFPRIRIFVAAECVLYT